MNIKLTFINVYIINSNHALMIGSLQSYLSTVV